MSDLNEIYASIKSRLSILTSPSEEHFTLPPFNTAKLSQQEREKLLEYKAEPNDAYKVVQQFDLAPKDLSDSERELRVKYLGIVLTIIDKEYDSAMNMLSGPGGLTPKMSVSNMTGG
jgi:hypothetical protein